MHNDRDSDVYAEFPEKTALSDAPVQMQVLAPKATLEDDLDSFMKCRGIDVPGAVAAGASDDSLPEIVVSSLPSTHVSWDTALLPYPCLAQDFMDKATGKSRTLIKLEIANDSELAKGIYDVRCLMTSASSGSAPFGTLSVMTCFILLPRRADSLKAPGAADC